MIIEGIVVTKDERNQPHIAPMGPATDAGFSRLTLRPFPTSVTFANLKRSRQGVFHVTDDVELLARAAVGRIGNETANAVRPASVIDGFVLEGCCRWFEFLVRSVDESGERAILDCEIVGRGWFRDFLGFNRGKNAVVEAAILATRQHLLDREFLESEFQRLQVHVDKTGDDAEKSALRFLRDYLRETKPSADSKPLSEGPS